MTISKIERVIAFIQQEISNKKLIAGTRLMSVRQLAQHLNYSVSTVVEAYARLVAEGLIEA